MPQRPGLHVYLEYDRRAGIAGGAAGEQADPAATLFECMHQLDDAAGSGGALRVP